MRRRPGDWECVAKAFQNREPSMTNTGPSKWANAAYVGDLSNDYDGLKEAVTRMLESIVGAGNAIVRISADVDFRKVEKEEEIRPFRVDPDVARISAERIKEYKSKRDQAKTEEALNKLVQAAERLDNGEYGVLMPAAIEAAKARATWWRDF
jgi:flagellar biosynthesis/type III secretory pathway M-ring protein FliF/YscJ